MHAILNVAIMAAREAASIINRYSSQLERVSTRDKGANQIVSEVDIIAEETIIGVIQQHYRDHKITGEESTALAEVANRESEFEWIIDPLDGTQNYLHGFPYYCVSIAVKQEGKLEHAVVLDPVRQEMFTATRGSGAHLNNQRMRVSKTRRLDEALLSTGMPFKDPQEIKRWLRSYAAVLPRAQSIHRTAASALDLAYVAAGRYDGLWQFGLKPWDMAAGALLIQEAGGFTTSLTGKQNYLETGEIVCGNGRIHEKLLQLVQTQTS